MVRRLEQAGHVERSASSAHLQAVVVRPVPHEERDAQRELLRSRLATALWGAAGDADLDRPPRMTGVVIVLRSVAACLHEAASRAVLRRDAAQSREGKRW
jgi:hypothetical protein